MLDYFLVTTLQFMYIVIKFLHIRHIVGDSFYKRLLITLIANVIWIITISVGVKNMIDANYIIIAFYSLGTFIGVLMEDKLRKII